MSSGYSMSGPNPNRLQNAATLSALLLLGLGLSSFARASTPISREATPALPRALKTERVYDRERLNALGVPRPSRLVFDGAGNLYVLDPQSRRVVKLDPSGAPSVELGGYGEDAGSFSLPSDLAIDSRQSLLVLDRGKGAVIAFDGAGHWLASRALGDDVAPEAFAPAARLLVDPFGSLWILAARERDLVPLDERLRRARQSRFLAPEDSLGTPSSALFLPGGGGWVYDQDAAALRRFDTGGRLVGAVSLSDSSVTTRAADLAADAAGYLYVADAEGQRILVCGPDGSILFARVLGGSKIPWRPAALAVDKHDRIAIADPDRGEIQILAIERGASP